MAAFKDRKNGSWYVQFRYTDWRGERQQKLKRGFTTKKEAQAWEREFLMQKQADVNMSFDGLKQELSEYKSVRSKLRTSDLEIENAELRGKVRSYEDVIQRNNLWRFFRPHREKAAMRDNAR